eukprot:tig00000388_g24823.t1
MRERRRSSAASTGSLCSGDEATVSRRKNSRTGSHGGRAGGAKVEAADLGLFAVLLLAASCASTLSSDDLSGATKALTIAGLALPAAVSLAAPGRARAAAAAWVAAAASVAASLVGSAAGPGAGHHQLAFTLACCATYASVQLAPGACAATLLVVACGSCLAAGPPGLFAPLQLASVVAVLRGREKEAAAGLQEAQSKRREAEAVKLSFLSNISHELRSPLSGILGTWELLMETELSGSQAELLTMLGSAAGGMLEIVNELLEYTKLQSGHVRVRSAPFRMRECLKDAISAAWSTAKAKNIPMSLVVEAGADQWFRSDAQKLRQVVLNYLFNAVKLSVWFRLGGSGLAHGAQFSSEGEVVVRVGVEAAGARGEEGEWCAGGGAPRAPREGEELVCVRVADCGPGIAREDFPRLFQRFSQLGDVYTNKSKGTGLGLSICREIAEAMQGAVGLTSDPERGGSTFFFRVPLRRHEPGQPPGPAQAGGPPAELEEAAGRAGGEERGAAPEEPFVKRWVPVATRGSFVRHGSEGVMSHQSSQAEGPGPGEVRWRGGEAGPGEEGSEAAASPRPSFQVVLETAAPGTGRPARILVPSTEFGGAGASLRCVVPYATLAAFVRDLERGAGRRPDQPRAGPASLPSSPRRPPASQHSSPGCRPPGRAGEPAAGRLPTGGGPSSPASPGLGVAGLGPLLPPPARRTSVDEAAGRRLVGPGEAQRRSTLPTAAAAAIAHAAAAAAAAHAAGAAAAAQEHNPQARSSPPARLGAAAPPSLLRSALLAASGPSAASMSSPPRGRACGAGGAAGEHPLGLCGGAGRAARSRLPLFRPPRAPRRRPVELAGAGRLLAPRAAPARPAEAAAAELGKASGGPAGGGAEGAFRPRVLLVDDERINLRVAQTMLQALGCDVDVEADGRAAVDRFAASLRHGPPYNLVVMDQQMPVLNGLDATRAIREMLGEAPGPPVLGLTANASAESRALCLAAGMADVFTKPFRKRDLRELLERWAGLPPAPSPSPNPTPRPAGAPPPAPAGP